MRFAYWARWGFSLAFPFPVIQLEERVAVIALYSSSCRFFILSCQLSRPFCLRGPLLHESTLDNDLFVTRLFARRHLWRVGCHEYVLDLCVREDKHSVWDSGGSSEHPFGWMKSNRSGKMKELERPLEFAPHFLKNKMFLIIRRLLDNWVTHKKN